MTARASETGSFDEHLDEMARVTDRLLATVDGMSDADPAGPSGLPGWTRGHVLTHLARQADGLANLARWARTGEPSPMYPGGQERRNADIEAGAGRHLGDLRLDVNEAAERLLEMFADFPEEARATEVDGPRGSSMYGWELPLLRIREVEIHHVDLDLGYGANDWDDTFAVRTLDQLAPWFAEQGHCPVATLVGDGDQWQVGAGDVTLSGPPRQLLAWLVGRSAGSGLRCSAPGDVPPAPSWV